MPPPNKILPKSITQSQLKMCLYGLFENHWYTMVWEDKESTGKADIWWNETIDWLEHVSLESFNPVVGVSVPKRPLSPTAYAERK
jgi:hypothetical protein